jgi:predicted acetyltransferase
VDGEMELIAPQQRYLPDLLAAARHPMTVRDSPEQSRVSRQSMEDFLNVAPHGQFAGDDRRGYAPSYHFWIKLNDYSPLRIAGGIGLRIGESPDIITYVGHIGYNVYPPARGRHLAERSCRLLLPLARRHGMSTLWITCNPDNIASRRTCERLGAELVGIVPVPKEHELYQRGDFEKCRYRLEL